MSRINSTWYRKRTNLERQLIAAVAVVCAIATVLVIILAVVSSKLGEYDDENSYCTSSGCIQAASAVLKYIDPKEDPCQDFYQFSCGGFLKATTIPEDKSRVGSFDTISDLVRDQLKLIIEEPLHPGSSEPYKLMKKFYSLCMNTTAIEEEGLKTVKSMVKEAGGYPLLEGNDWRERDFDWKEVVYKFSQIGIGSGYFVGIYVGTDDKNSTSRALNVGEAGLGLSREFLVKGFEEKIVKAYYEYMVDIAVFFGADKKLAQRELNATLDFEIKLAKICLPKEEKRNSTLLYNPTTLRELQRKFPVVPWVEYANKVLRIPGITLEEDELVIVSVPKYLADVETLLRQTPKRVIANYMMRRAIHGTIYYLTEDIRNRQLEYYKILTGQTERESRWKECTRLAAGSVWLAAGSSYVRKFFRQDSKKHAQEMVDDIRAEFVKILQKVDWMDETTRHNALEKAASMLTFIGYPDELIDERKIEKFYSNMSISTDSYFKSMKELGQFFTNYYRKKLREPINKTDWIDHSYPTAVNAFYSALENSIEFPAGILQGVFFDADRPRYMNYGAIGYVIGHEITHGFDDEGRQFDKEGNLNEWWAEDTKKAFIKKAQCIIDQYGNYTATEIDMHLNGINTQGENIADNGGIKEAYLAYQSWVARNSPEKILPGLKYTPNQLFWISAANVWCSKQRKESLKMQISTGYHSPSEFRILGPFSNNEHFAKDFNCPLGTKMNPVKKCQIW